MENEQKHGRGWTKNNSINGASRKDERRKSAMARKAISDKLSPQQKLDKLDKNHCEATRERFRLHGLIAAQKSLAEKSEATVAAKVQKKRERTEKAAKEHAAALQGK